MKFKLFIVLLFLIMILTGCMNDENVDDEKVEITFESYEGTQIEQIVVSSNELIKKPDDPKKLGHSFDGWYFDVDFMNVVVWPYQAKDDIKLYAKWIVNEYTIFFDTDGGKNFSPITLKYGEEILLTEIPEKNGYNFIGWYLDENYNDLFLDSNMPSYDFTLFARWEINKYFIEFESNGGNIINSIEFEFNTEIIMPLDPVKDGYHFMGWYLDENHDIEFSNIYMPANDLVLYAKWMTEEEKRHEEIRLEAIDYLMNKDYLPDKYYKYINEERMSTISSIDLNSILEIDTNSFRIPIEDFVIPDKIYGLYENDVRRFKVFAENFKNLMNELLPFVDEFNKYQQIEGSNLVFKLVTDDPNFISGLHFYLIDTTNREFVYLHNYYNEGVEVLELSITKPTRAINDDENLMETITFQNIGNTILRLIDITEIYNPETPHIEKYSRPFVIEMNLIDETTYEVVNLQTTYGMVTDGINYEIRPDINNISIRKTIVVGDEVTSISMNSREDITNRFSLDYYPDKNKPEMKFYMTFLEDEMINFDFDLFFIKDLKFIDYTYEYFFPDRGTMVAINLVTTDYIINFDPNNRPIINSNEYYENIDGDVELLIKYSMRISYKNFESVDVMFDELDKISTTYDIRSIYENKDTILETVKNTNILGVKYLGLNFNQWIAYLNTNFIGSTSTSSDIFEDYDKNIDVIKPLVYGTSFISQEYFQTITDKKLVGLITVIDDIDGFIEISMDDITLIKNEENKVITILYKVYDSSGNMSQHVINVI